MSAKSRMKSQKKASGGKTTMFEGAGSPEAKEAASKKDGFKTGGAATGMKSGGRLDRKPRASGGRATGGGSPFTAAHNVSAAPTSIGAGHGKQTDGSGERIMSTGKSGAA